MDYRLACDTALFAAIAPVAGTLLGECPTPAPVSVLHLHGLADHNIPFDGSPGAGTAKIDGPPVEDVIATWRTIDHCGLPVTTTAPPVTTSRATCDDGRVVELISVAGAGHQWPGSVSRPVLEKVLGLDPPSTALNATDTIWTFFSQHHR